MAREVTTIPSTLDFFTKTPLKTNKKKRVAAYARVSTDNPEQLTSFETQKSYFAKYIKENPDWEIVSIYADEGISGTCIKHRKSFQNMVEMVRRGEIDIVLAKSVSRFARNVLDTVSLTREFRGLGVDVFFEEDNLHTIDPASEFTLAIYASIAQEESRHISENVKWSLRHNFSQGKVTIAFSNFLGFKRGENGEILIDENEAPTVREIYRLFLIKGMTPNGIAKELMSKGYKTVRGGTKWTYNNVVSILTNEKYKGEAILQKGFVKDYLEHKMVKNEGQLAKYHVKNSHPAIIDIPTWDMVQLEIARRAKLGASYSSTDLFGSRVFCADCGSLYGKKLWHSNDKYTKSIYQCNKRFINHCHTPNLSEEEIKEKFLIAYGKITENKEEVLTALQEAIDALTDTKEEEDKLVDLNLQMTGIEEANKKLIEEKKSHVELPDDFEKREKLLISKFNKVDSEINSIKKKIELKGIKKSKMESMLSAIKNSVSALAGWNRDLWMMVVESAEVNRDGSITFVFFGGMKVRV